MPASSLRIDVYDSHNQEWRMFWVVPVDKDYKPQCKYSLHQFGISSKLCACGMFSRVQDDGA